MDFSKRCLEVRMKLNLSQEMLARKLDVSFATVNRWESGRCHPNYGAQKALAEFCKAHYIDVDTLEDVQVK